MQRARRLYPDFEICAYCDSAYHSGGVGRFCSTACELRALYAESTGVILPRPQRPRRPRSVYGDLRISKLRRRIVRIRLAALRAQASYEESVK